MRTSVGAPPTSRARSEKRSGPSESSRTISSDQRSPIAVERAGEAARLAVFAARHRADSNSVNLDFKACTLNSGTVRRAVTRIADLTWKHPKLVLAAVGVFALLAIAVGHDVEQPPEGGRLHRPRLRERAGDGRCCATRSATTPTRRSSSSSARPAAARSTPPSPPVRREVDRLSREMAQVEYVGRVVNPLRDPRAGAELIARDGRVAGDHRLPLHRRHRGRRRDRRRRRSQPLVAASPLDVADGRLRRRLQRDQRPDPQPT